MVAEEAVVLAVPTWAWLIIGIILIALAVAVIKFLKNFIVNSALGIAVLLLVNYFGKGFGLDVPINFLTVVICGVLGLAGAGLLLLLAYFGIKIV